MPKGKSKKPTISERLNNHPVYRVLGILYEKTNNLDVLYAEDVAKCLPDMKVKYIANILEMLRENHYASSDTVNRTDRPRDKTPYSIALLGGSRYENLNSLVALEGGIENPKRLSEIRNGISRYIKELDKMNPIDLDKFQPLLRPTRRNHNHFMGRKSRRRHI
jgi:hypothetical protein